MYKNLKLSVAVVVLLLAVSFYISYELVKEVEQKEKIYQRK